MGGKSHHLGTGVVWVFLGGVLGTLARYGVATLLPPSGGWPWGTLVANLTGAFLLGTLLETLSRGRSTGAEESQNQRRTRLFAGTGVLGGYTTYSSFALESDRLVADGRPAIALAYVVLTLLAGLGAAFVGVRLAAGGRPWRRPAEPVDPDVDSEEG